MFVFSRHKSLLSHLLGIVLTIIISLTIGNRILFTHVHVLPDGEYVVHAHPFSKDEGRQSQKEQHSHSNAELYFILALDTLMVVSFVVPPILLAFSLVAGAARNVSALQRFKVLQAPGRAPPYCG
jgi:hypothetical protein